ncbi:unnamed protein product [Linum trigynum]|uniref:Secreted protein n=1 Tax=Linum trigynum TaxID=586398 RepID=A0AAV2ETX1_9ROSI
MLVAGGRFLPSLALLVAPKSLCTLTVKFSSAAAPLKDEEEKNCSVASQTEWLLLPPHYRSAVADDGTRLAHPAGMAATTGRTEPQSRRATAEAEQWIFLIFFVLERNSSGGGEKNNRRDNSAGGDWAGWD